MVRTLGEMEETLVQLKEDIVSNRRYLHQHPELSFEEQETSRFIENKLKEYGIDQIEHYGKYGLIGRVKGALPGPTVALRADFDALPIQDQKDVPYKSTAAGKMHACGHDGHTSALLGIGRVLKQYEDQLKGEVILLFQPAEEKPPGGAQFMIEDGVLKEVDVIFGAHLDTSRPVGTVSIGSGYQSAAVDYFKIEINGHGGHGAYPHQTIDSLVIGTTVVNSLQQIVSRKVNPQQSAVVTVGQFHAGQAFNIIPDSALIEGTVRTFKEDVRNTAEYEIQAISKGIAASFGASANVIYERGYPSLYNHVTETDIAKNAFIESFGEDHVLAAQPGMGAEDFAFYLEHKPGSFFKVGARNEHPNTHFPHHHPLFDFDEEALIHTGKAFLAILKQYVI
ncbi:amidohydrolase [Domibacillus sp. DTU_2020_1001157_1_SI_ALB_TIR_016]|uniref:M20 metallopeptidase family protein n=1 Tax=Domibacillus sp. DTU_2020_1001157_1_SI_ALB_TIR_016 TaxID=3077789 RepID=UPI0028EA2EB9|nr:amidohydrolase [Domibacillus sp. DTU_2020_1001157_1_SI_ALB_TIR_016]WNS79395.1 amidohydrolase [Domibacillus sp. DTU_2020_1001157_1_SI_ALB_TIR_016]